MEAIKAKINFNNSGYYFIGLYVLAVLGFWPSYFAKFFNGAGDFAFYFHFHAAMVTLWVFCLVIQPMLIRKKMLSLHRLIGKASYVIMPMLFLSVILLAHYRIPSHIVVINNEKNYGLHLFIPFKDLLVLGMMYTLAIRYRHNIHIHARAMVATGIVLLSQRLYASLELSAMAVLYPIRLPYLLFIQY
jgi:heme exporter protein D